MKVHKYEHTVYEGFLAANHGDGQRQTVIYVPRQGVIGYRTPEQIDFFSSRAEDMTEAQEIVDGMVRRDGWGGAPPRYLGDVEVPDNIVAELISSGNSLNQAKGEFGKASKLLIGLVD